MNIDQQFARARSLVANGTVINVAAIRWAKIVERRARLFPVHSARSKRGWVTRKFNQQQEAA